MLKTKLFIGFKLTETLKEELNQVDPILLQTFFTEKYLIELTHNHHQYFGNFIGECTPTDLIKSSELYLHSLMKKLIPELSLKEIPFILIAVKNE